MNARVAAVLVLLLAVLGGGALIVHQRESIRASAEASRLGRPVLADLQAADVQSIALREAGSTLTLQRREDGWTIAERAGFPADADKVRELVVAAVGLRIGQSEPIAEQDRARLKLDGAGTRIDFRGADGKTLAALIVGRKFFKREPRDPASATADGRFVLLPDAPGTAEVVADPLRMATAASAPWISKTGFGAEKVRAMEVDFGGGKWWRIERPSEDGAWKLTPLYAGEKLDVINANSASYSLNRVNLSDVAAPGARPEDTGLDKPVTIVASTFDHLTYTLKLGKPHGDDYYATLWISGEPKAAGPDAAKRAKQLAERLPQERSLAGEVLLIGRSKFEDILKKRVELLEKTVPAKK
jgi:Domain of unknown function (DUF4340)